MTANVQAERAVLGAVLIAPAAHRVLLPLVAEDFTDPRNRALAGVLRQMVRGGAHIDVVTACEALRARGLLDTPGGVGGATLLHDLASEACVPQAADHYAGALRQATRVRAAGWAAAELSRALGTEQSSADLDVLLARHRAALLAIPEPFTDTADGLERDTVTALLAEQFGPERWIVPGWLARQERAVLTGAEGLAKSTVLRQVAVCIAGGLNPWNGQRVTAGHRVLFLDAENSRHQSHNAYRWIGRRCTRPAIAAGWSDRIVHKTRNDGVDLPGRDLGWFHQVCEQASPDVIIVGPAYKLMRGDPQKDSDVLALLAVLDEVRVKYDAAVLVETHSPHGGGAVVRTVRPYGSSVWLRWPEAGFGLRQPDDAPLTREQRPMELNLVSWRGQRETRDWPDVIEHGGLDDLPWRAARLDWAPSVDTNYGGGL